MTPMEGAHVARLIALTAFADDLPLTCGALTLHEIRHDPLWRIAPFAGQSAGFGAALRDQCGLDLPPVGQRATGAGGFVQWDGHDGWLVAADLALDAHVAAVVDYADALACLQIHGAGVLDVLARLVPMDLRLPQFGIGACALTLVGLHPVRIVRLEAEGFEIMVTRSMAASLLDDLRRSALLLAARMAAQ
jgi:heterotetrameric sarcosine oxidase gamma subunit